MVAWGLELAMLDGLKVTSEVLLAMRLESQGNQFLQANFPHINNFFHRSKDQSWS